MKELSGVIQMSIDPDGVYLTFGAKCGHEIEDTVQLSTIADENFWPICPDCGADLDLVNVIVDIPSYKWPIK